MPVHYFVDNSAKENWQTFSPAHPVDTVFPVHCLCGEVGLVPIHKDLPKVRTR
jgi:hypothetical protein